MENTIDWEHLALSANPDDRDELWEGRPWIAASAQFIENVQAAVHQEQLVIIARARDLADSYWRLNKIKRDEGGPENQGYFGTRVRVVGASVSMDWYLNRFAPDSNNPAGKKLVFSTHLRKGLGFGYSKHAFSTAKQWEKEAIQRVEPEYKMYRQRNAALTKIRRAMVEYEKILAEQDGYLNQ